MNNQKDNVPHEDAPNEKEQPAPDNVYQGISVEKFLSILDKKGVDPKNCTVRVYYKKPENK